MSGNLASSLLRTGQPHGTFINPVPFDPRDLKLESLVADRISNGWRPAEHCEDQAADAVDILVLEIEIELLPKFVEPHRPGNA